MPSEPTTIMSPSKPTILVQLDTDAQPSVFDAVVAVDAGVQHLFRHVGVTLENVHDLVYGTIFTRGPADLNHTAIFIGGSNVPAGEAILDVIKKTFLKTNTTASGRETRRASSDPACNRWEKA